MFSHVHLHGIFKTEEDARNGHYFTDEAGYYDGVIIEERIYGNVYDYILHHDEMKKLKRIWLLQQPNGELKEIEGPKWAKSCVTIT